MSVSKSRDYKYALEWYTIPQHSAVQLKLLAEISDTLLRLEEQRFAEFEYYKQAVKRMEKWDTEGLSQGREIV